MSETSKLRKSRINLTYYRTPDALWRRRRRLIAAALVLSVGWFVAAPLWGRGRGDGVRLFRPSSLASKGPVARVHSTWDANCEACHLPFAPVVGSRWSPTLASDTAASNAKCQTCHAGPAHFTGQDAKDKAAGKNLLACAECHRDHRGSDASLISMDETSCTSCHRDLSKYAGLKTTAKSVTRFSANENEHPAFTPPAGVPGPDSGMVKFNHARHLTAGIRLDPKSDPFTFADLDERDRTRYGWKPGRDREAVQLRCETCHRLDRATPSTGTTLAVTAPRNSGDSILPVSYENDCRACHPITFDAKASNRTLPHGLKIPQIIEQLTEFYEAQAVKDDPAILRRPVPPRPIPGRLQTQASTQMDMIVSDRTLAALKRLFSSAIDETKRREQGIPLGRGGCVECHEVPLGTKSLVDLRSAESLAIKPTVVRAIWFEGAKFDHAAHRALDCASCHAGAETSKDQSKLLLPGPADCVSCHAPVTTDAQGHTRGGAGTSCVECHRYHEADQPSHGIGSASRKGTAQMTVEQFLEARPGSPR